MSLVKVTLLFSLLVVLFVTFGAIIGYMLGNFIVWISLFLVIAVVINVFSYYKSDSIAIKSTKTKLIEEKDNPRFYNIVKKVTTEAGIPMPRVGIMPSDTPNAFATGRDKNHSVVVATSGILSMLDDDELEAVIGHEVSHITHEDILVTTIAATIAMIISYIGNMVIFSEMFGGIENRNASSSYLLIVAAILIPLGAMFVQLGISRSRESDADIGSVKLVKKPDELISSLEKISKPIKKPAVSRAPVAHPSAYSSLFIVNNFSGHALLNLFSTHPSLEKRIETIQRVKKEMGL